MSWPRGSLLAALLALSVPLASADTITVNTTTDDYLDNTLCSLREAVEYFNRDKPQGGFQGCITPSASLSDNITVPANASPYLIGDARGAIIIQRSLDISGASNTDAERTTLKVEDAHRAFIINDVSTFSPPAASPAGAPSLDPADTGLSAPGSNLTTTMQPVIVGQLSGAAPPATPKMITVYYVAADGSRLAIGKTTIFDASGKWSIQSAFPLSFGLHEISFTLRDATDPENLGVEGPISPALKLAVYAVPEVRTVNLSKMEIIGCAPLPPALPLNCANPADDSTPQTSSNGLTFINTIANTTNNGGIIYTNEVLKLSNVTIRQGHADQYGGAVYADVGAGVGILASTVRNNSATLGGGALYLENSALNIGSSLFNKNTATAGAIIEVASDTLLFADALSVLIENATIGENTGVALVLKKDNVVNASTIISNTGGGVDFSGKVASVYNTILSSNGSNDCLGASAGPAVVTYSLLKTGNACPVSATNQVISDGTNTVGQLLVANDALPCNDHEFGLLCRLADNGGETLSYKPHILPSFTGTNSDPNNKIINRASQATSGIGACPTNDQRTKSRARNACDIGAVELQVLTDTVSLGDVITYGEVQRQFFSDGLEDEELFNPALVAGGCPATPPTVSAYSEYARSDSLNIMGCPWVETPPGRGSVIFNADGSYTYTPASNFHGFDRFTVRVLTPFSRLAPDVTDQSRLIQVTVIVEPPSGISSSSLGGAVEAWELLMLAVAGLVYSRRRGKSS